MVYIHLINLISFKQILPKSHALTQDVLSLERSAQV